MLKVQCKRRCLLKFWQFNAYKNSSQGLQRATSQVRYVTNPDKPCPRNMRGEGGKAMLCCFREEEETIRGARKNRFIYELRFCLLINVLKQRFSTLFLASPCSALHISLTQIFSSAPTTKLMVPLFLNPKKGGAYDVTPRKAQHKRRGEACSHARVSSWEIVTNTCHKLLLQNEDS